MHTPKSHRPKHPTLTTSAIPITLSIIFFKQYVCDRYNANATVNGDVKLFYVYTEAPLEEMEYEATDQDGRSFTIQ